MQNLSRDGDLKIIVKNVTKWRPTIPQVDPHGKQIKYHSNNNKHSTAQHCAAVTVQATHRREHITAEYHSLLIFDLSDGRLTRTNRNLTTQVS